MSYTKMHGMPHIKIRSNLISPESCVIKAVVLTRFVIKAVVLTRFVSKTVVLTRFVIKAVVLTRFL
jgi:hypothetical protein